MKEGFRKEITEISKSYKESILPEKKGFIKWVRLLGEVRPEGQNNVNMTKGRENPWKKMA